ncbi:unnamed protein product [Bursaphelenchus okinawaensis]|uniref:Mitochondrial fission 1 protein n=1 Tax=Bursaphelenchus okinawaensis TaxID=465554 RepID=A0A811LDL6_9BILA|nr:unnamed protein product [Bursaphelenchus okinawaensis]CAG9123336.1 unnamed protein product [Bursaphelenchus okinawaensis]
MDPSSIVDEYVEAGDLEEFARTYRNQQARGPVSDNVAFNYAHALIRSTKENVRTGIFIFEGLLRKDDGEVPKRDYVYFLAVAYTRLKEYDKALEYINALLYAESDNRQAVALRDLINQRMKKDSLLGLAVIGLGGVAAVGASLIAAGVLARRH